MPALLVHGANVLGGTVDGVAQPRTGEESLGDSAHLAVEVHSGQIIVWYDAAMTDITGISVGRNAVFDVHKVIAGDVVSNLAGNGRLTDSDNDPSNGLDGRVLLPHDIRNSNFNGTVGSVVVGGSISDSFFFHVAGGLYTGNGAFKADAEGTGEGTFTIDFGPWIDINPVREGVQNTIVLEEGLSQYGRNLNIQNIDISFSNTMEIWAGDGATRPDARGGIGGSILNIDARFGDESKLGAAVFTLVAGDGGGGSGTNAGGAGGHIADITVEGSHFGHIMRAGNGGNGDVSGGAGGRLMNLEISGQRGEADERFIELVSGSGGEGPARGGRAGDILDVTIDGGNQFVDVAGGSGGDSVRRGGDGGRIVGLEIGGQRNTDVAVRGGDGGAAEEGAGGRGGMVVDLNLSGPIPTAELAGGNGGAGGQRGGHGGLLGRVETDVSQPTDHTAEWEFRAGSGGESQLGRGGNGGHLMNVSHTTNPTDSSFGRDGSDDTFRTLVFSGDGGDGGMHGGHGGSITGFSIVVIHDQRVNNLVILNPAVVGMRAGDGGSGGSGAGGNGGSVRFVGPETPLRGLTFFDQDRPDEGPQNNREAEAIQVYAGNGGSGQRRGGTGGNVISATSENGPLGTADASVLLGNMLMSGLLVAGDGGSTELGRAGNGGSIVRTDMAVSNFPYLDFLDGIDEALLPHGGNLSAKAGNAGDSQQGIGGSGGHVRAGFLGVQAADTQEFNRGLLIAGGSGGDGGNRGGIGGTIGRLEINTPNIDRAYAAVLVAGHGGDGLNPGSRGGNGGNVGGISQTKDVTSYINVIHAGNGGDGDTVGGRGGSVGGVRTIGLIGIPSSGTVRQGAFNTEIVSYGIEGYFESTYPPQGVFAGRGGSAGNDGMNGRVANVTAQQIAAIGAAADADDRFHPASVVTGIRAQLIGYDIDRNGFYDPGDGFILADRVGRIITDNPLRTDRFTNPDEFTVTA